MGIFSGIEDAKGTEGGLYFPVGNFLVEIQRCKSFVTRKNVRTFVAEFVVLESDTDELRVKSPVSYMVSFKDPDLEELYKGNIADFARVAFAALALQQHGKVVLPKDVPITEALMEQACSDVNPLVGVKMKATGFNKPTKAGDDFTRMKWAVPVLAAATKPTAPAPAA